MYTAYAVRYVRTVEFFRQLAVHPGDSQTKLSFTDGDSGIKHMLSMCIGPPLVINSSNDRIAAVIAQVQKTRPVRSLAIWGWAPGVYVLTGIPPATRDSVGHFIISAGPMQQYFRSRFLQDLSRNPPDLFIDAVATDAFKWPEWAAADGYESDPSLRKFIDENYVLVYELKSTRDAKPVRFFARKALATAAAGAPGRS
jgi:hypothetical protein